MNLQFSNRKRNALVCLNMSLWAVAIAVIVRLWRNGDGRFWRGFTKSAGPDVHNDNTSKSKSAAFRQSPQEGSIVMDISDFDADPALAVYDVEIRRRPNHHHHF